MAEKQEKPKEKRRSRLVGIGICLIVLFVALLAAYILLSRELPQPEPEPYGLNKSVKRFVNLYLGLINTTIETKTFKGGLWIVNVTAIGRYGPEKFEIKLDENLSVVEVMEKVKVPIIPPTYSVLLIKDCAPSKDEVAIDIYVDPYDPWTKEYLPETGIFLEKFGVSVHPTYYAIQPATYGMSNYSAASLAVKYLACIKDEKEFLNATECMIDKYDKAGKVLNQTEIEECITPHTTKTLETIKQCVEEEAADILSSDEAKAETDLEGLMTYFVVIDCKYRLLPIYLESVACYFHPNMEGC